jgi:hypothetical protein
MSKINLDKPNGITYSKVWIDELYANIYLCDNNMIVRLDKKIIPQLIEALQVLYKREVEDLEVALLNDQVRYGQSVTLGGDRVEPFLWDEVRDMESYMKDTK